MVFKGGQGAAGAQDTGRWAIGGHQAGEAGWAKAGGTVPSIKGAGSPQRTSR